MLTLSSVEQIELLGKRSCANTSTGQKNGPIVSNSHHQGLAKAILNLSDDLSTISDDLSMLSVEGVKVWCTYGVLIP